MSQCLTNAFAEKKRFTLKCPSLGNLAVVASKNLTEKLFKDVIII